MRQSSFIKKPTELAYSLDTLLIFHVLDSDLTFLCEKCNKGFKVLGSLKRHAKYYCGRKPPPVTGYIKLSQSEYECERCQRRYKTYNTLKRHLVYECGKPPTIQCPVVNCEYKAKIRDRMMQHCRMVHKLKM
ncbi:hypothetical protein GWI33_014878 [Rhynchophorus ferrugineus]|uniref:C2H2-type domain-containing protein n=1 Tax=Rhynchophorus ferrugineus TaxID=354439 RepID=A0A834I3M6_RHYFE|nr:hypothetical protein GWI33_014878 [Rhynchophorus ferrugineus]